MIKIFLEKKNKKNKKKKKNNNKKKKKKKKKQEKLYTNSEDPDQTLHCAASDQGLHCFSVALFWDIQSKMGKKY